MPLRHWMLPLLLALPVPAPAQNALERLKELAPPTAPSAADIYADEIAADRDLIASEADSLFDPARPGYGPQDAPVAIVIFTGPGCAECAQAEDEIAALADSLNIRASVIDTAEAENAALMDRLTLDLLPSYVLPGSLIRGSMPAMVLERYLAP
ncbi:hypothetical protein [Pseudoruegeria sp. HB172150]|uniref:hypothetical protein n=1 Tax=Pseudoruegeria sp. HB172150 TaxID=2721164 RepID=UPI001551C23C|nr:hypothetical protein [Pseudoruegeria sp. HB172150]